MKNNNLNRTLVKESAEFFKSLQGREQMRRALEKVSGEVELQPPLTLEKLMSVFGATVLIFPPEVSNDKPLKIGRISTEAERENWLNALAKLDRLYQNPKFAEEFEIQKQSFQKTSEVRQSLEEITNLESFAEEIAIRAKLLVIETNGGAFLQTENPPLPNLLRIGEQLVEQLEKLVLILPIEEALNPAITLEVKKTDSTQENRRTSSIATETLLKKEFMPVSSSASYQAMREVVALNKFRQDLESPYPTAYVEKATIKGKIQLTPLKSDSVTGEKLKELEVSMWRKREQLSDLHVDVIDSLCATWIIQASNPESQAVITADDVLKLRGLKPHLSGNGRRGGFTAEQRTEIIDAIQDLENVWFEITEKIQRGKKTKTDFIQSRAMVVLDRGGQMNLDGSLDVTWFIFRPGSIFARYLLTEGRQTALLSAHALRYNIRTEAIEKRLVRYMSWQWRIRSKSATYLQPYDAQTLAKECGLEIPKRNAHRVVERLEKALDRLQTDGLIASWQYTNWDWEKTKKHGWINEWLSAKIAIEPPDFIKDSYQSIHSAPLREEKPKLTSQNPQTEAEIAEVVKTKRKLLKLTQMQLAEQLDLSQATLARIEGGKRVSDDAKRKAVKWVSIEIVSSN